MFISERFGLWHISSDLAVDWLISRSVPVLVFYIVDKTLMLSNTLDGIISEEMQISENSCYGWFL